MSKPSSDIDEAIQRLQQAVADAEQMLRDWQDHLQRVHHLACDFPFRSEVADDE